MLTRLMLALGTILIAFAPAFAADKTKIVLIGKDRDHPPRTHEYMAVCQLLANCLKQTPGIEPVISNGWPKDPAVLKDAKAIVLYTAVGGDVMFASPHRREAEELMKNGVGLTTIHWATGAGDQAGEQFLHTQGAWFNFPKFSLLKVVKTTVRQADASHPISRGWKDYDLHDEYYVNLRFMPDIKPLMKVEIEGKEHVVGWAYERRDSKGGRSFGTVLGHFHVNFGEKPFRQALVNGILWTAHVEVPEKGAPCEISAKDLELPPDAR